ncbi:MAG: hypothetical protein VYD19_09050 [Myxococcota bacterium]|nr:hypothetical protein [Myxococcota bacterium]
MLERARCTRCHYLTPTARQRCLACESLENPRALALPFVGRASTLARLQSEFERTSREGQVEQVSLVGDPGVGLSSLCLELCRRVSQDQRELSLGLLYPKAERDQLGTQRGEEASALDPIRRLFARLCELDETSPAHEKARRLRRRCAQWKLSSEERRQLGALFLIPDPLLAEGEDSGAQSVDRPSPSSGEFSPAEGWFGRLDDTEASAALLDEFEAVFASIVSEDLNDEAPARSKSETLVSETVVGASQSELAKAEVPSGEGVDSRKLNTPLSESPKGRGKENFHFEFASGEEVPGQPQTSLPPTQAPPIPPQIPPPIPNVELPPESAVIAWEELNQLTSAPDQSPDPSPAEEALIVARRCLAGSVTTFLNRYQKLLCKIAMSGPLLICMLDWHRFLPRAQRLIKSLLEGLESVPALMIFERGTLSASQTIKVYGLSVAEVEALLQSDIRWQEMSSTRAVTLQRESNGLPEKLIEYLLDHWPLTAGSDSSPESTVREEGRRINDALSGALFPSFESVTQETSPEVNSHALVPTTAVVEPTPRARFLAWAACCGACFSLEQLKTIERAQRSLPWGDAVLSVEALLRDGCAEGLMRPTIPFFQGHRSYQLIPEGHAELTLLEESEMRSVSEALAYWAREQRPVEGRQAEFFARCALWWREAGHLERAAEALEAQSAALIEARELTDARSCLAEAERMLEEVGGTLLLRLQIFDQRLTLAKEEGAFDDAERLCREALVLAARGRVPEQSWFAARLEALWGERRRKIQKETLSHEEPTSPPLETEEWGAFLDWRDQRRAQEDQQPTPRWIQREEEAVSDANTARSENESSSPLAGALIERLRSNPAISDRPSPETPPMEETAVTPSAPVKMISDSLGARGLELAPPPSPIIAAVERLIGAGYEAWVVGGSVRDRLLGRPVTDWDLTTSATPEEVSVLFERVIETGIEHGTVTLLMETEEEGAERVPVEVTTYRVDGEYQDGRHPSEVTFTRSLREDLARRDLTVNAIAWDPTSGTIQDPFSGAQDLDAGLIRAVGVAAERFAEAGLRVLRAVRFASTLRFTIVPETWQALCAPAARASFAQVARERVRVEVDKILASEQPSRGLSLLEEGALFELFWPSIATAIAESPSRWRRLLHAIDTLPLENMLRLTFLLSLQVEQSSRLLRELRYDNKTRSAVTHLLRTLSIDPLTPRDDAELRALVASVGRGAYESFLVLQRAHTLEDKARREAWDHLAARVQEIGALDAPQSPRDLVVGGHELCQRLSLRPGPQVGQLLRALLEHVWAHPEANEREALFAALPPLCARLEIPLPAER